MEFVLTDLVLTDLTPKWGLAIYIDKNHNIIKEQEIPLSDVQDTLRGGKPKFVDIDMWNAGQVYIVGRPCREKNAVVDTDGNLIVNKLIDKNLTDVVNVSLIKIPKNLWILKDGNIYVDSSVVIQLGKR